MSDSLAKLHRSDCFSVSVITVIVHNTQFYINIIELTPKDLFFIIWSFSWKNVRSCYGKRLPWQPENSSCPDNKVHGANMVPTWVLSAPDGPHVGPMNLAIREGYDLGTRSAFLVLIWEKPTVVFHPQWTHDIELDYYIMNYPDIKVHGANMGPIWGRQDPGGPHIGPMNFAIRVAVQ